MPRAQRGDFTGQQRERLAEENAQVLAQRQQEVGLVNQVDTVIEEEGVFDPSSGQVVEMSPEAQARIESLSQPVTVEDDPVLDPTNVVPGYDPMKDLQDMEMKKVPKVQTPNAMEVQDLGPEPMVVEDEWRVIRVNTDIEDMTYGAGTSYTFLRGRRYRVPRDLYNWLDSRGVVYH
jgi:hypothetical protein